MADAANIKSPQVLLDIRRAWIALAEHSERVLLEGIADIDRVENWLRHERLPACRRQQRMCEQRFSEARIRYMAAKSHAPKMGRPMIEDEEKEYRRCKAALEHSTEKLQAVEQALLKLPRLVEQAANRIQLARHYAQDLTPRAIAALDTMIEGVQHYLNQTGGSSNGGTA